MKLVAAFDCLELHVRGRVIDLLPHPALRLERSLLWPVRVKA